MKEGVFVEFEILNPKLFKFMRKLDAFQGFFTELVPLSKS